jgi:predicted dehydrogenase
MDQTRGLRLAISHPDEAGRAGVRARLRGAAAEPCPDLARFRGPPDGCDAVLLAGPGLPDPAAVGRLLSAGAHVLLVADPCPPGDVIEGLFGAARTAGVRLAVVNPDRYLPSRQLVRRQLPEPLGEPGLIRLHRWEPAAAGGPSETAGLPEPLVRDLDVTLWLAGRRPDRVYAVEPKGDESATPAGRYVQVHLSFPGGGMALLDFDNRLPPGDGYQSLSVIAAAGAAYADDHQNVQLLYRGGRPQAVRTEERAGLLAAIAQEFIDALRAGRDLSTAAAEWRAVFAVADAVVRSLASGRAVSPEEDR